MIRPAVWLPLYVAVGALALSGCSQAAAEPISSPSGVAVTPRTPATPDAGVSASPAKTPGWSPKPVSRPGALPTTERIKANPEGYRTPVKYSDGLTVAVTAIKQQTVTQVGPGAITGEPMTLFTVTMHNGAAQPMNLNQVVVSAYYGTGRTSAAPVYEGSVNDFAGELAAGSAAAATYAFSIPIKDLGSVTLAIDFDGRHTVAVFTGSAR